MSVEMATAFHQVPQSSLKANQLKSLLWLHGLEPQRGKSANRTVFAKALTASSETLRPLGLNNV